MKDNSELLRLKSELFEGKGTPPLQTSFTPDPFQLDAVNSAASEQDTLVVAPTGAGKTFIAVEAIAAFLKLQKHAVYTTPLKALSNTKYNELRRRFEPDHSVGLLTGDRKIETESEVVVATTEIYRNELYRSKDRFGLVVLDEVHFIADPQRGPVWEESIILTPRNSTLLMLSASISNPHEIAAWLENVRGKPCTVIIEKFRPVELRYGFIHPEYGVIPLRSQRGRLLREVSEFYEQRKGGRRGDRNSRGGGQQRGAARRGRGGRSRER
jgi:superfamily II RNA helicase